jgi:spermidine synthase
MHIGDARLTLAKQPAAALDILVMDVFSSDAVPTHLLTREAFSIYDRVLAKDGVLLIHISNRYLDLEPVLASEAKARGWASAIITHRVTQEQIDAGETTSVWVMMARSEAAIQRARGAVPQGAAAQDREWRPLSQQQDFTRWTDEFGSILYLIKRPDQAK